MRRRAAAPPMALTRDQFIDMYAPPSSVVHDCAECITVVLNDSIVQLDLLGGNHRQRRVKMERLLGVGPTAQLPGGVYVYRKLGEDFVTLWNDNLKQDRALRALAIAVARDISAELARLHGVHRVVHGDVKVDNVVVTRTHQGLRARLVDFGGAFAISEARKPVIFTHLPEPLPDRIERIDVYAFGKMLEELGEFEDIARRCVNMEFGAEEMARRVALLCQT